MRQPTQIQMIGLGEICARPRLPRRAMECLLLWLGATLVTSSPADSTFVYAVQISSQVQAAPARITLSWEADPYGATNYTVYRKAKEATSWGTPVAKLGGNALGFTDTNLTVGGTYEYEVIKNAYLGYTGYGYVFSGIEAPLIENRGTVVLVVAQESTVGLSNELARLESDLAGDGWQVLRHNVSSNDAPQAVRALIQADYQANPASVNTVFLLGHVPILQSGYLNYDGHGFRPMPADAYYGEMNNDWPVTPTNSPSYLPSDVALMVGRVDLANMPGAGAPFPWPSEIELLRGYLDKDHLWRTGQLTVPRRALMGNRRGDEGGLAVAASGYRAFEPLVGPGNTLEADTDDTSAPSQRWSSLLAAGGYLWAYGCGGGQDTAIGYLGTHDSDYEAWSTDLVDWNAHGVFVMMFGSHLGNWDHSDNIMRAVLATPQTGLACCMAGEPHWFFHHMGLGETIGYSTRLTMNNRTLYQNQINQFPRAVYIALMGDPTLRMEPITPPGNLNATTDAGGVHLTWTAPQVAVGYHIYRAGTPSGPFARLNSGLIPSTGFTDITAAPGSYTYMVRAVRLQTNFSGSYFNPSQGIFAGVTVTPPTAPVALSVSSSANKINLSWPSQAGMTYHVEATPTLNPPAWQPASSPLSAVGPTFTWSTALTNSTGRAFYRVVSP